MRRQEQWRPSGRSAHHTLRAGERVAMWPLVACGHCYPCRIGRENACANISLIGVHRDGALQDRLRIPASRSFRSVIAIPPSQRSSSPCRSPFERSVRGRVARRREGRRLRRGTDRAGDRRSSDRPRGDPYCSSTACRAASSADRQSAPTPLPRRRGDDPSPRHWSGRGATGQRSSTRRPAWPRSPGPQSSWSAQAGRVVVVGPWKQRRPAPDRRPRVQGDRCPRCELLHWRRVRRGGGARRPTT